MRLHYYFIRVGEHTRCEQARGPREACKKAFGVVYDDPIHTAVYKDIGTRRPAYFSNKKKRELLGSDGWSKIPKTGA